MAKPTQNEEHYYVIQVAPKKEPDTVSLIRAVVQPAFFSACFYPVRRIRRKMRGTFRDVDTKLLPGYVFVTSNDPLQMYLQLKRVPMLTKVLGKHGTDNDLFIRLDEEEAVWLDQLIHPEAYGETLIAPSKVMVDEDGRATILSGPLKGLQGNIRKLNLHRRIAEVEVTFMRQKTILHLGIELVHQEDEKKQ